MADSALLRGPVTVANLEAAAGALTGDDGFWWPCLNITFRTPVPTSITKITAQVREKGADGRYSQPAEQVLTKDAIAAGAAKIVNGVSLGQHLQVRLSPAGAPGLPFQPTPWVDVTTPWDAIMAETDGLTLGCVKIVCGVGDPTRTDLPIASLYIEEGLGEIWQYQAGAGDLTPTAINIAGTDLDAGTNTVTFSGVDALATFRVSKPRAAASGGLLDWDAYNSLGGAGGFWQNYVAVYGNNGGADTLLFASNLTQYANEDLAFHSLADQLPQSFTGYTEYKVIGTDDFNPADNTQGLSVLVQTGGAGWVLKSDTTSFLSEGVEVANNPRSINFTGSGVGLVYDDEGGLEVQISGGGDLGWFNVTDYGATGDGSTDDTSAIQDAIDAAEAAGGGVVYFPVGVYVVNGSLQDTSRSNSQLLLPRRDTPDTEQITIELRGAFPPPTGFSVVGSTPLPDGHSVIKGTLNTGSGTTPALLGAWGPVGTDAGNFSFVHVVIRDLTFRMPSNPVLTALNLSHVTQVELDNVVVDCGFYGVTSLTEPTTSTSYGICLPAINNGAQTKLGTVNVIGFYTGYWITEHAIGEHVNAWGCKRAFEFVTANYSSVFTRLGTYHCQRGLVFTGGVHHTHILEWAIEHAASGTWLNVYDVDDASNYAAGALYWHTVLAGVGLSNVLNVNGAKYLKRAHLDYQAGHYALTDGATVSVDWSVADTFRWTIGGNRTLANPTAPYEGEKAIRITQDGTGGRTLTLDTKYVPLRGATLTLATTAGAVDILRCLYDATADKVYCALLGTGSGSSNSLDSSLLTEGADFLITEGADFILTEP